MSPFDARWIWAMSEISDMSAMSVRWKLSALGLASGILAFLASGFASHQESCLAYGPYDCVSFAPNLLVFLLTGVLAFVALGCVFAKWLR